MYVIMQSFRGNEDPVNCLTTSEIIYSELQRIFMKSKGKEDCNKLLKLVVCFVTVVSPVSEKVCMSRTNSFICFVDIYYHYLIEAKSMGDTM